MIKKNVVILALFLSSLVSFLNAQESSILSREDAVNDLEELFRLVDDAHFNPYLYTKKEEIQFAKDSLSKSILLGEREVRKNDFLLEAMQLLAKLNDAHTSIQWWSVLSEKDWERPIFLGDVFKADETGKVFTLEGKQVLKINNHEAEALFKNAMACYGGNYMFRKNLVEKTFFSAYLYFKGIHPPFQLTYLGGAIQTSKERVSLTGLLDRLTPQEVDYKFEVIDNKVGVIYYNSCTDIDAFRKFLKSTFKEIKKKRIKKLIVDVRSNTGGNSMLNDLLLSYLTRKKYRQSSTRHWRISKTLQDVFDTDKYKNIFGQKTAKLFLDQPIGSILKEDEYLAKRPKKRTCFFAGKSCLLIGPTTFSSANFLADAVSTYNLMPIIGLPTGETTNDFGEQIEIELPESKLTLTISVAYDIGADGNPNTTEVVKPDVTIDKNTLEYAIQFLRQE